MPVLRIIWMALLICVLIYGAVLWAIAGTWEKTEPRSMEQLAANPILLVLALTALISMVMAFTIPNMLMRGREPTPDVIRARSIVQWALIESVAIDGLVGAFIVQDARVFLAFASVAILGFLLRFPSAELMSNQV